MGSGSERMRELGRRGGIASGEARRRRKLRGVGEVALEMIDADPRAFVAGILESGNAYAKVRLLELALARRDAEALAREAQLEERDRRLREAERTLDVEAEGAALTREWQEQAERQLERTRDELAELERARDALRDAIEREARAADMELVEVNE